jgi:hypothetical protein
MAVPRDGAERSVASAVTPERTTPTCSSLGIDPAAIFASQNRGDLTACASNGQVCGFDDGECACHAWCDNFAPAPPHPAFLLNCVKREVGCPMPFTGEPSFPGACDFAGKTCHFDSAESACNVDTVTCGPDGHITSISGIAAR